MSPMSHKPKYFVPPEDASGQRFCRKCGAKLPHNARTYFCQECTPQDAPWKQLDKGESQASAHQQSPKPSYPGPKYMCPRCHTTVNTADGCCPSCDHRGKMLPIETPQPTGSGTLEETGPAPTPVRPVSAPSPQTIAHQQSPGVPDAAHEYRCPQCDARVDPESGLCPQCGWMYGPPRKTHEQSTPAAPVAASEGTIPPSRSPLLNEITAAEPKEPDVVPPQRPLLTEITFGKRKEWGIPQWARQTLASVASAARKAARPSQPTPTGWSIPPSTRQLLLRGFWAAVFLAIAGLGSYYAVTKIGDVSLPSTSTANPITNPIPPPAAAQTYTLATDVNSEAGGQVSPSPENETYTSGIEVTLTATAASGYTFDHWGGDVPGSSAEIPVIPIIMDSNKNVTAYFKLKGTTPPDILAVEVSPPTDISATMTWQTDEDATSQVEYWKTDGGHETTALDDDLKQSHTVRLTGLEPSTTYHFRIKSVDASGNEATSNTKTLTTLSPMRVSPEVGNRAPDFTFPLFGDETSSVSLSDSRGKKVLLNFWSTRCGACIVEFPLIRKIHDKYGRNSADLIVITVCTDGERTDRIQKLIDKYGDEYGPFNFPILLDKGSTTHGSYEISAVPRTFFIDSEGIIREIQLGRFDSTEEIEDILESL